MKKIGGFFPLYTPQGICSQSVLSLWGVPEHPHRLFSNGRSALHHLIRSLSPGSVWLPAYSCDSLAEGVIHSGAPLRFFPIVEDFSPDIAYLSAHVRAGDAVVAIDYFGRNPDAAFLAHVASHPAIHWIEDRSQAFLPAPAWWGDYVLYSPRKLLGVADGALIVSRSKSLPSQPSVPLADPDATHPALLRAADVFETHNAQWHAANQTHEASLIVDDFSISRTSHHILAHTDVQPLLAKRRANYAQLMAQLSSHAALPAQDMDFVPMGFPIRTAHRASLSRQLAECGIFAAHHWPHLPAPEAEFSEAHRLSQQLLTLPCDHRYGPDHMQHIIDTIGKAT